MDEPILRAGNRLDRYELLCPIASGGMAAVWLAQLRGKRGFEKLFAIKTIKTELTDDPRFQEMFLDEARIASGIEHPNVAHILDLGEQGHVLYIVMEWVDGESLGKISKLARRRKTPVPLAVALRAMADTCAGLHAAHELRDAKGEHLGVVHRDVSPQNILITSAGSVKVIDFGVAKARNRIAGETGEGVVKGKIRYMAPEQVRNHDVDRRADVWAVGVCLHELVTGRVPFESDTDIDVLKRLMSDEPTPIDRDAIPPEVADVLESALTRDPEQRFASAAAMRRALEATIVKLDLDATSDDVAEFVRSTLPELEAKRREVVAGAIEARAAASSASMPAAEEVGFAPTVVYAKTDPKEETPAPSSATRRGPALTAKQLLEGEDSKVTRTAFTDEERAALPSNRGYYAIALLVALGAGAWFVWPGAARLRGLVRGAEPAPIATPSAEPSAIALDASVASASAPSATVAATAADAALATAASSTPRSATSPPTGRLATATATTASPAPTAPPTAPPTAAPEPTGSASEDPY